MKKLATLTTIAALSLIASGAFAATQIQGVDAYITGDEPGLGSFSPTSGLRLLDDGIGPDAVADDGIFTTEWGTPPANEEVEFKAANSTFDPVNLPSGFNYRLQTDASPTTITIFVDVDPDPTFVPNKTTNNFEDGIIYTSLARETIDAASSVVITGDFQSEFLGGVDFDPANASAVDMADLDNDGFYTADITGLPSGTYNYKIVLDDTFGPYDIGGEGFLIFGPNFQMTSTGVTDTITVTLNAIQGTAKAESTAVISPGFYAQSSAWSTGYTAAEELGTPTGGVYEKVFSVATAGDYTVRVRDENTDAIPETGDIPFTTTTSPQDVVVIYDTNTYADGYQPAGNFVLILDEATRTPLYDLSYVQVVGQFQADFLGGGAFNAGDTTFEMTETASGTYLYTLTTANTIADTGSGDQYKAVGQRVGSTDTGFNFQLGGAVDNLTITGNNASATNMTFTTGQPLSFKLDAATGRILGVAGSTLPADPTRPSYLNLSGNVSDWSQY